MPFPKYLAALYKKTSEQQFGYSLYKNAGRKVTVIIVRIAQPPPASTIGFINFVASHRLQIF